MVTDHEWQDLVRFEGNAQGFRLLNKPRYQGLKLTAATLAAFTKYPRPSALTQPDLTRRSQKKYGFFSSEAETFAGVASDEIGEPKHDRYDDDGCQSQPRIEHKHGDQDD